MTNGYFMISMLVYTLGGGLYIGFSIDEFKKGRYCKFGIYLSLAISLILLMAKTIFSF